MCIGTRVNVQSLVKALATEEKPRKGKPFFIQRVSYKGYSPCRLCDTRKNGSLEWVGYFEGLGRLVMPEGYLHYVAEHNVCPTAKQLALLDGAVSMMQSYKALAQPSASARPAGARGGTARRAGAHRM